MSLSHREASMQEHLVPVPTSLILDMHEIM